MKNSLLMIVFLFPLFLGSCSGSGPSATVQDPTVVLSDVTSNGCLNVEKLTDQIERPGFIFPAAVMTTDFKTVTDLPSKKAYYHAYSAFYYHQTVANQIQLLRHPTQTDCNVVRAETTSGEPIEFEITESSPRHLVLKLKQTLREDLPDFRKKALRERLQPFEYKITFLTNTSLEIETKYNAFDPLCESKNSAVLWSKKFIDWRAKEDQLPQSYDIDNKFIASVRESLGWRSPVPPPPPTPHPQPEPQPEPTPFPTDPIPEPGPVTESRQVAETETPPSNTTAISISEIKTIMTTPISDELKKCN